MPWSEVGCYNCSNSDVKMKLCMLNMVLSLLGTTEREKERKKTKNSLSLGSEQNKIVF